MLRGAMENQKQEANELNESAIEYSLLKRDVDTNRTLYEGLLDEVIIVAAGDGGHQLIPHAVGVGASNVVAFQEELAACSADTNEAVADFVEAGGRISGTGESENGEGEQDAVEDAAEDGMWGRHHLGTLDFRLQILDCRLNCNEGRGRSRMQK